MNNTMRNSFKVNLYRTLVAVILLIVMALTDTAGIFIFIGALMMLVAWVIFLIRCLKEIRR